MINARFAWIPLCMSYFETSKLIFDKVELFWNSDAQFLSYSGRGAFIVFQLA